jgi:hypothetical protein
MDPGNSSATPNGFRRPPTRQAQTVAPIEKGMSNRYAMIEYRRNIKPTQDITIDATAGTSA